MRLWRISNFADLSGRGGMVSAGRWNFKNMPIVYSADHPATALLEMLVHIDAEDLPSTYQLLEIHVPDAVGILVPNVPDNWKDDMASTRRLGSDFISARTHPMMAVPCAIVPFTKNYLLNPVLLEHAGIGIVSTTRHPIDQRLIG